MTRNYCSPLLLRDWVRDRGEMVNSCMKRDITTLPLEALAPLTADPLAGTLHMIKLRALRAALIRNEWHITNAAHDLGVSRQALHEWMKQSGISKHP